MEDAQGPSKSALKKAEKQAKMAAAKAEKAAARTTTVPIVGGGGAKKGDESKEIIGMTVSKEVNFSQWYHDLVIKAELVEYYSEVREKSLCICSRLSTAFANYRCWTDFWLFHPPT